MSENDRNSTIVKHKEILGVLLPGSRLRDYEFVSVLGQGTFGITYRARHASLNRDVAIKEYLPSSLALRDGPTAVLPRSTEHTEEFVWGRERFLEEARTLATLSRASAVVRVFDFLEANGTAYIVMELAHGETLASRIETSGRLSPQTIERILYPVLDGLEQVHDVGFLHRDIKPANIILDARDNPTLIDFGAARVAMAGRTSQMTAIFTPGYAAREQFTSGKQGPWTDIYGLSATVYHAITGRKPPSALERMGEDRFEPIADIAGPTFPAGLLAGIDAGMALREKDRPQSIADWRRILSPAALPAGRAMTVDPRSPPTVAASSEGVGTALRPPSWKRSAIWIAASVATLSIAAGSGYLALAPSGLPLLPPVADAERARIEQAEQRRAEDAAADTRRQAETAAREKAAADERQRGETEIAARQKAEAAAATRQEVEAEARQKAAVETAARQKAEAEATARVKAEAEARQKAEAELGARQRAEAEAEADARQKAEAAEAALLLSLSDRQRVQVALTSLGYETRGTDGIFGPRSREMIVAWQRKQNQTPTGFLTSTQNHALLTEAAGAVARFDAQKKVEEDRKKAEEGRAPAPAAATPPSGATAYDGGWTLSLAPTSGASLACDGTSLRINVVNGYAQSALGPVSITRAGAISGTLELRAAGSTALVTIRGSVSGNAGSGQISGACGGTIALSR